MWRDNTSGPPNRSIAEACIVVGILNSSTDLALGRARIARWVFLDFVAMVVLMALSLIGSITEGEASAVEARQSAPG
jgi:hypothetical protein